MAQQTINGSFSGSNASKYEIKCECTSITNNATVSSDVTVQLYVRRTYGSTYYDLGQWSETGASKASITINGVSTGNTSVKFDTRSTKEWILLLTHSVSGVGHETNGAKSIQVSATFEPNATSTLKNGVVNGTFVLDTIPRASLITEALNTTLGSACSITWTPASAEFQYKLDFTLGSWAHVTDMIIPNQTMEYTYTEYTIPSSEELLNLIPNSTTGIMTVTLHTYGDDGVQIGESSSKTFNVLIPSNIAPVVGAITLTPNTFDVLIQGKNTLTIQASGCEPGTGSTIASYTFAGPGVGITTTHPYTTTASSIIDTGELSYTITVTDSRGRTASKKTSIHCYSYNAPIFTSFSAYRCNANGASDASGTNVACEYQLAVSDVSSTNKSSVTIFYKPSSEEVYASKVSMTESVETSGKLIIGSISNTSTYSFYATVSDIYGGTGTSSAITVFSAARILNISADGTGFAIGKMSEKTSEHNNGLLECKWDARLYGTLTVDGSIANVQKYALLYDSTTGTTDNLTLSQSAEDFNYLELFMHQDDASGWWSVKVPVTDDIVAQVGTQYYADSVLRIVSKTITIRGTELMQNSAHYTNIHLTNNALNSSGSETSIKIMRVLGYK